MVKRRIIEEASGLFAKAGVKNTTMDDLAKHMGISKRTIYENFKDKEALLVSCIEDFHEESKKFGTRVFEKADNVVEAAMIMLQKGAEQAMQVQFDMMNDIRKYYPQVYKDHLSFHHADKHSEMAQLVKRGIDEGVFREDLNPDIIAHVFSNQADGISFNDKALNRFSSVELFENMVICFLRGICTQKGIEIIDKFQQKNSSK